jgi:hypothetical protein
LSVRVFLWRMDENEAPGTKWKLKTFLQCGQVNREIVCGPNLGSNVRITTTTMAMSMKTAEIGSNVSAILNVKRRIYLINV